MKNAYPASWTKTIDDLINDGADHPQEEWEWARAYERARLKEWVTFPRDGQVYECVTTITVLCSIHWKAPYTSGCYVELPEKTFLRVHVLASDLEPISVTATPLEYEKFETVFVSPRDRRSRKYDGYSLSVTTAQLNRELRLVSAAQKPSEHETRTPNPMQRITRSEAKALALSALEKQPSFPDGLAIQDEYTIERPWGWVFFYNSKKFVETGNDDYRVGGNAPLLVNRFTCEIRTTGTAHALEHYLGKYESELDEGK